MQDVQNEKECPVCGDEIDGTIRSYDGKFTASDVALQTGGAVCVNIEQSKYYIHEM